MIPAPSIDGVTTAESKSELNQSWLISKYLWKISLKIFGNQPPLVGSSGKRLKSMGKY